MIFLAKTIKNIGKYKEIIIICVNNKIYKEIFYLRSMKKKVTLSIDSDTYNEFQKYCEENAIMLSKKIELWIRDFLNEKKGGKNE